MRKKQANPYLPEKRYKQSPYLTKEQIRDFESQFTLFDKELNLMKLQDAMANQNYQTSFKPVYKFVDNLSKYQESKQISFDKYYNKMSEQLRTSNQGELITSMLDEHQNRKIDKDQIKQILEDALGRQILAKQMDQIMLKLFDSSAQSLDTQTMKKFINQNIDKEKTF